MKLVQLNLWQGRIIRHAVHFIEQEKPDILCMQEIYASERDVPTWDAFSSVRLIRDVLPHEHFFFAPLYSFEVAGRPVTMGNAILSRFPIHNKHIEFVNGHYVPNIATENLTPDTRNFQSCELELPDGKRLSVVNHHACWDGTPKGSPRLREKMQIVKEHIDTLPRPLILTGDMNVVPTSETMQIFNGTLENLTETHNAKTTLTQLARALDNDNIVPCDNTLVSPEIKVTRYEVSDYLVSDHKGIIVEFEL
jgi:endonuclease/exonuclease/phosphatase family metal-dependent hydrolase